MIFVAVDFETTGLSPAQGDAIVEIGAVKFRVDGTIISEFTELANPGRSIPSVATRIHGISDRDVAHCPSPEVVWRKFSAWAGDYCALVAHNAPFERRFIIALAVTPRPQPEFLDTLALARSVYGQVANHKLVTLCEHLRYSLKDAHRALPDARATAFLLADIVRRNPSVVDRYRAPLAPKSKPVETKRSPNAGSSNSTASVAPVSSIKHRAPGQLSFKNGVSYVGEVLNGQPDGNGEVRWPNGSVYVGDFVSGLMTGKGEYRWPDGSVYRGDFASSQATGKGEYHGIDDSVYIGDFIAWKKTGKGEYREHDGLVYIGDFVEGLKHGQGKLVMEDGTVYVGDFLSDQRTGKGEYRWPDGSVYRGDVVDGWFHGIGTMKSVSGLIYEGQFFEGLMHGNGTLVSSEGSTYEGQFVGGLKSGHGRLRHPDGTLDEGTFSDDFIVSGVRKAVGGVVYSGPFKNGSPNDVRRNILEKASNPVTSGDELSKLISILDYDIAVRLAANPSTPGPVIAALIDSEYVYSITPLLLRHHNCPKAWLEETYNERVEEYFCETPEEARTDRDLIDEVVIPLAQNTNADPDILATLHWIYLGQPDVVNVLKKNTIFALDYANHALEYIEYEVAEGLLSVQKINHDILAGLAKHESTEIRLDLARRSNLSAEVINTLAVDEEIKVRLEIARRNDLSGITRRGLAVDSSRDVRREALKHEDSAFSVPLEYGSILLMIGEFSYKLYSDNEDILEKVAHYISESVELDRRKRLASQEDCPVFVQCLFARDASPEVRLALLDNERCSTEALSVFARDPIYEWRVLAAKHDSCTDELLKKLSFDKNSYVRRAVKPKRQID